MKALLLLTSSLTLPFIHVQADSVALHNGQKLAGRIRGLERDAVLLETVPVSGYPAVNQRIAMSGIAKIEFGADAERDRLANTGGPADIRELKAAWTETLSFLGTVNSPAGKLGLRYALLLMQENDIDSKGRALDVFSEIYKKAFEPADRTKAAQGRLRTLTLSGKQAEAVREAGAILKEEAAPPLCAEARLVVAAAQAEKLRAHLEENPRWNEDERAAAERGRLRDLSLDSYLLAGLASESPPELAVRGLLGALQIHELCGETGRARDVALDITSIYPGTPAAQIASAFLARSPSGSAPTAPLRGPEQASTTASPSAGTHSDAPTQKP